jgi:hypothetical protein
MTNWIIGVKVSKLDDGILDVVFSKSKTVKGVYLEKKTGLFKIEYRDGTFEHKIFKVGNNCDYFLMLLSFEMAEAIKSLEQELEFLKKSVSHTIIQHRTDSSVSEQ